MNMFVPQNFRHLPRRIFAFTKLYRPVVSDSNDINVEHVSKDDKGRTDRSNLRLDDPLDVIKFEYVPSFEETSEVYEASSDPSDNNVKEKVTTCIETLLKPKPDIPQRNTVSNTVIYKQSPATKWSFYERFMDQEKYRLPRVSKHKFYKDVNKIEGRVEENEDTFSQILKREMNMLDEETLEDKKEKEKIEITSLRPYEENEPENIKKENVSNTECQYENVKEDENIKQVNEDEPCGKVKQKNDNTVSILNNVEWASQENVNDKEDATYGYKDKTEKEDNYDTEESTCTCEKELADEKVKAKSNNFTSNN